MGECLSGLGFLLGYIYCSVCSVNRFGLSIKPKPKPNTEQCKTRNRTANRKPKKLTLQFGSVRFGSVCGLRLKNAQADNSAWAFGFNR